VKTRGCERPLAREKAAGEVERPMQFSADQGREPGTAPAASSMLRAARARREHGEHEDELGRRGPITAC
jgi:hypothetical protein